MTETLPDHVHDLALEVTGEREMTLHASAIETDGGLLLVDTGLPESDELTASLDAAGFTLDDISTVFLTHQDADHAGGLAELLDETDATVLAHERAAPIVDGRELPRSAADDDERYPPARVDVEVDTATLNTRAGPVEVIPTPGHTPGHVSLYFPEERFLVAADALTADEDGLQGPRSDVSEDMNEALSSAERLAALDIERVLCYHGGFVAAGDNRIAEIANDAN